MVVLVWYTVQFSYIVILHRYSNFTTVFLHNNEANRAVSRLGVNPACSTPSPKYGPSAPFTDQIWILTLGTPWRSAPDKMRILILFLP